MGKNKRNPTSSQHPWSDLCLEGWMWVSKLQGMRNFEFFHGNSRAPSRGGCWGRGVCVTGELKYQRGVCSAAIQPVSGAQPRTIELSSFSLSPSEFFFLLAEFFQVG
ncbi:hypothetical protein Nmel_016746 [Mimus melanotis]